MAPGDVMFGRFSRRRPIRRPGQSGPEKVQVSFFPL
jgi:hypothetical protein